MFLPLLCALLLGAPAAAQPSSYETVWRNARAAMDRGDNAGAAKMVDDALAGAGTSNVQAVWKLRILRALLFTYANKPEAATKILAQSLPAELAKTEVAVRHLHARAMLGYFNRDGVNSDILAEQARVLAEKHVPHVLPEMLLFTRTEKNVREAIRLAKKSGDKIVAAKGEAQLVFTLANSGRFAEALRIGEPLTARLQALNLRSPLRTFSGNLGWIYFELGDFEQAASLLSLAVVEAERTNSPTEQLIWFATLSNVHITRRDWQSAIRDSQQVVSATVNTKHRSRGHAFSSLARAYLELGRIDDARAAARQSLALEINPDDDLITRVVEARIDIAAGQHDTARKTLLDVIAKTNEGSTTRAAAQGQLGRVYGLTKQNDLAAKAFDTAVDFVRDARAAVTKTPDQRLTYFNTAAELFDNYVDFLVGAGRHDEALRVTESSRAQTLAEGLGLAGKETPDPRAIARKRGATILCYWLGRNRSYVWTVTPSAVRLTTLPKNDLFIEDLAGRYAQQLLTPRGTLDVLAARGQALYDLLVKPAASGLPPGARVIVVPDGRLHTLNFETLVTPAKRFWIEDVILASASSLQLLARDDAKPGPAPSMLLVGNPTQADAAFPVLKQAADEILRIKKRFPRSTVLDGKGATPASYKAAKPKSFDFVHFVAHGVPASARPLDSAVILSLDADRNYRLVARDIAGQPLDARLVTISSCHGAGTTTYAGEGLVGLAWAFLHAGAHQVVAALWAVNDTAAPKLMDEMYAGIRAGRDPAGALRDAKLALLKGKTSYQHARYWAPFVVYQ